LDIFLKKPINMISTGTILGYRPHDVERYPPLAGVQGVDLDTGFWIQDTGILEYWNTGILEQWNNETVE